MPARSPSQLHTLAAYYPEQPTDSQAAAARNFINGLAALYPCKRLLTTHLQAAARPPPAHELSEWLSALSPPDANCYRS